MPRALAIAALGLLGWLVSYAFFVDWLLDHELAFWDGWVEAFTTSGFATGLLSDLVVVTLMMVAIAGFERRRIGSRWALAMVASLGLSVSVSLAIYLLRMWMVRDTERPAPAGDGPPTGA